MVIIIKKDINVQIGQRVKEARRHKNLTREQLAEMLGISSLFMGYIECGQKGMSLSTLQKLCYTLEVSADYILLGIESKNTYNSSIYLLLDSLDESYLPFIEKNLKNIVTMIKLSQEKCNSQTNEMDHLGG